MTEEVYSSSPNLTDQPLENADMDTFMIGSSFVDWGLQKAGYTVVTHQEVLEAEALPPGTFAQKAELTALVRALCLRAKKKVIIYTEYAFSVMHTHGAMWKERHLLTSGREEIKHTEEILALLDSIIMLEEVAIVHCPGHQKTDINTAIGNILAGQATKWAARTPNPDPKALALIPLTPV